MMRACVVLIALLMSGPLFGGVARAVPGGLEAEENLRQITIFSAASLQDVTHALVAAVPGMSEARLSVAASSTLARQILHGAQPDIFLSANLELVSLIRETVPERVVSVVPFAENRLVLVTVRPERPGDAGDYASWLKALPRDDFIALADTAHVPAGLYAKAALQHAQIWALYRGRIAQSDHVRGALALAERGEVAAAIVYRTDVSLASRLRVVGELPAEHHPAIKLVAVQLDGAAPAGASRFTAFLISPAGQAILRDFGFVSDVGP